MTLNRCPHAHVAPGLNPEYGVCSDCHALVRLEEPTSSLLVRFVRAVRRWWS